MLRKTALGLDASIHPPSLHGERESVAPSGDLLLEVGNLLALAAGHLHFEILELVGLLGQGGLRLLADLDGLVDVGGDGLEVLLAEATASHDGGAVAESAGGEGALVAGDAVLVAGEDHLLQDGLDAGAVEAPGPQVQ